MLEVYVAYKTIVCICELNNCEFGYASKLLIATHAHRTLLLYQYTWMYKILIEMFYMIISWLLTSHLIVTERLSQLDSKLMFRTAVGPVRANYKFCLLFH